MSGPAAPVLFLLDEFAALGRLEPVERAFGLMAGYGLQLWPILQDMHQLWAPTAKRPEPSSPTPAWCRSSTSPMWRPRAGCPSRSAPPP
ncbi:type IV secretory system conjugative DNA transfer family protein [Caulobacter sp. UC70_42]|uniref:type IV secretory system conjugative DNA transfer family protein n=1 Tax=Caulobacter sp. UC70_42 TaxID=3374551 RepID=UPI0037570ECF